MYLVFQQLLFKQKHLIILQTSLVDVPYHVIWAVSVVVALSAEVVEADADAAELLVADAVVPVHLAPPPLHAPPEGNPHAPGRRFSKRTFKWTYHQQDYT